MKDIQNKIHWILQEKYKGRITDFAKKDIERLKAGEPVDYLIGFVNFLDCKIDLSKKPLIPRIETEYWTDIAIKGLKKQNRKLKILDMFAGSGCIGISIIRHVKKSKVIFSDYQKNCIEQIKINCRINNIRPKRYKIIQSDIFKSIKGKFDYIFANPPYIAIKRKNEIQKSVLKYEPKIALFGGKDGLSYIRKFLAKAKNFLSNNGKILMEFDYVQKKKIEYIINKSKYKKYQFFKDQYDKWRYVIIG